MNILDFETNFENAAKTFLARDLSSFSSLQYLASLDQTDFTIPRIEINAELQGAEDPPTNGAGHFNYSQYSLNLIIKIITDASDIREVSTGLSSADFHRRIRREVRASMLLSSDNFDDDNLEYYEVKYMRPTGTDYEIDGDLAISSLSYEIKFCTKDSKWDIDTPVTFNTVSSSTYTFGTDTTSTVSSSSSSVDTSTFPISTALSSASTYLTDTTSTVSSSSSTFASGTQATSFSTNLTLSDQGGGTASTTSSFSTSTTSSSSTSNSFATSTFYENATTLTSTFTSSTTSATSSTFTDSVSFATSTFYENATTLTSTSTFSTVASSTY